MNATAETLADAASFGISEERITEACRQFRRRLERRPDAKPVHHERMQESAGQSADEAYLAEVAKQDPRDYPAGEYRDFIAGLRGENPRQYDPDPSVDRFFGKPGHDRHFESAPEAGPGRPGDYLFGQTSPRATEPTVYIGRFAEASEPASDADMERFFTDRTPEAAATSDHHQLDHFFG